MPYECRIKRVEPQPVLSIRGRTSLADLPRTIGEYLQDVWIFIEKTGNRPCGPPFTRYHSTNDDDAIDLEAGLPVPAPLPGAGRIHAGVLPGGEVLATDHIGPYELLPRADEALDRWLASTGRRSSGPNWEFYWTDPGVESDPAKWRTEVLKPLAPTEA